MTTKIKKRISSFALIATLVFAVAVPAFAKSINMDGGTWDYGTRSVGWDQKEVYSNYLHPTKIHMSSCSIGAVMSNSGWINPRATAFSSALGKWGDKTHAYYNVK